MSTIKKLTGLQIIETIIEKYSPSDFAWEEIPDEEFGKYTMVDDIAETTGDAWKVLYFEEQSVYIRINGYYNSYESYAEFEEADYDIVEPYQAVVTFYESNGEKDERAKVSK